MLNRRQVLGRGLAVSALSALPARVALSSARRFSPAVAIVDRDLPGAPDMASRLGRESAALYVFGGDPGSLWMQRVEPALRERPAIIAGYTSRATLFCLQYLSQAYGLELAAGAEGAAPLDRLGAGAPELPDLRDPRTGASDRASTWVLAPRRV